MLLLLSSQNIVLNKLPRNSCFARVTKYSIGNSYGIYVKDADFHQGFF
jgi:hypothetical protein